MAEMGATPEGVMLSGGLAGGRTVLEVPSRRVATTVGSRESGFRSRGCSALPAPKEEKTPQKQGLFFLDQKRRKNKTKKKGEGWGVLLSLSITVEPSLGLFVLLPFCAACF